MDAMPRARTANQEQEAARAGRRLGRARVVEFGLARYHPFRLPTLSFVPEVREFMYVNFGATGGARSARAAPAGRGSGPHLAGGVL